jgi:hypothetical protein
MRRGDVYAWRHLPWRRAGQNIERQSAITPELILASSDRLSAAAFGHGPIRWNPPLFVLCCSNVRSWRNDEAREAQDQAWFAAY